MKSNSADERKLLLVKYLPELISDAKEIQGRDSVKEKHTDEYFYYLKTSASIENESVPIVITLVKRNNGNIQFYNHNIKEDTSATARPESPNGARGTLPINVSSKQNISQNESEGKEKPKSESNKTA